MPLAQSLPALRQELRDILTEDLAAALNALKELLPEGSDKHRTVLELRARFNDANKQSFRGVITNEQLQLVYNQIRSAVFDLLGELEEADFEPPAVSGAASAKATAAKQGSVLYRVPHRMPLRKPSICTVRVALDDDAILEDIVLDDDVRLRQRVEVSDMMKAELLDPEGDVFAIRPLSEAEQLVRGTGYTQWLFSVTPRIEGEHQLLVKVSMMEYNANLGKYIPREVSILETITIVTETAVSDSEEPPLKATGERFTLGPDVSSPALNPAAPPAPPGAFPPPTAPARPITNNRQTSNRSLRATVFFLIFLMVGTTATWAFTPQETLEWWEKHYWENTPDAYAAYIEKYKDSDTKQHLEKAYFHKADKTGTLRDLRDYQRQYPHGQFRERVLEKVETLEVKAVTSIQQQPEAEKIRQFVADFPESERLPEIKQAVAHRAELLPVLENAYVASIQAQPSPRKVTAFLRDFPRSERLPEVAQAAAAQPEVLRVVQPELENAFLQKMEQNPTAPQAEAFLQNFPVPVQREKFERILEKKPALKKQFLQKMEKAAEAQKAREAEERRLAAERAAEEARLQDLQRRAAEERDATERTRLEKEAADEAERQRLKKEAEAAAEAERQRLEAEARRDTDADGVTDKDDKCPDEKGDAANSGCPAFEPPKGKKSGFEMVRVQGGTFTMGDDKDDDKNNCEHPVTVKIFEIGKYEVTQADWREVMGGFPTALGFPGCDDCPVERVSWDDIQDFIKTLNRATTSGKKYRLPTEAEWEYAARGGSKSKGYTYSGSNDIGKVAWYYTNSGSKTHPIGEKAPNELGLYDMSGNVWEWCQDTWRPYPCDKETKADKSVRVLRGGSWYGSMRYVRAAVRLDIGPTDRGINIGFRLAQD